MHSPSYDKLLNLDEDAVAVKPHSKRSRHFGCSIIYGTVILLQALVIMVLAVGRWRAYTHAPIYLYSPAEAAVQQEVRTFFFGIGDDLSPFQQPPSDELDAMWLELYDFGISRIPKSDAARLPNKTSVIPSDPEGYYIAELDVFHQLHCLNMIRQALYPDHYPHMRMGTPKTDEHVNHCVDSIRQSLMCASDTSVIVWQWDEVKQKATFRGNVAHTCRNFDLIRAWGQENRIQGHFEGERAHIVDEIRVPVYHADGSSHFEP